MFESNYSTTQRQIQLGKGEWLLKKIEIQGISDRNRQRMKRSFPGVKDKGFIQKDSGGFELKKMKKDSACIEESK